MSFKDYVNEAEKLEVGFVTNIEKDTIANDNFRKVIFTAPDLQLVLMTLKPNEDIGEEVHENADQFFRVDEGSGKCLIGEKEYDIENGSAFIVPQGNNHNVMAGDKGIKLYTIYSKAQHKDGEMEKTKEESNQDKEQETVD